MAKKLTFDGIVGIEITSQSVRGQLESAKGEDIEIDVSSPGGLVSHGLKIFDMIENYEGNVVVNLVGVVASIMTYIVMAADKINAKKNSIFLVHEPWNIIVGNRYDLEDEVKVLKGISDILAKEYSSQTKKSIDEIRQIMKDETYIFSEDIKNDGFADDFIDGKSNGLNKQESIAKAKISIENCLNTLRESERAKSDLDKAAAWIQEKNLMDLQPENNIDCQEDDQLNEDETQNNNPESSIKNNKERKNYMTKDEFRQQHSELYNEVYNDGVNAGIEKENKRCLSFVEAMNVLPTGKEIYIDAIKNKKDVNDASIQASILAKIQANNEVGGGEAENPEDANPESPDKGKNEDQEVEALTNEVLAISGMKKKDTGGKLNG